MPCNVCQTNEYTALVARHYSEAEVEAEVDAEAQGKNATTKENLSQWGCHFVYHWYWP